MSSNTHKPSFAVKFIVGNRKRTVNSGFSGTISQSKILCETGGGKKYLKKAQTNKGVDHGKKV